MAEEINKVVSRRGKSTSAYDAESSTELLIPDTLPKTELYDESSLRGSMMNLCNSTLGAGCLSLPFAISQAGLGFGTIYLFLTYYTTVISLYYLLKARAITGKTSYEEIICEVYGHSIEVILSVTIILFCFGSCVSYCVVIGDILNPIVDYVEHRHPLINRENTVALFWLLFIVPPSMMKDMGSFTKFSIMGVWLIYYLIGLVVVYCLCNHFIENLYNVDWYNIKQNMWKSFPIIFFSFTSHLNVFQIQNSLEKPSENKMRVIVHHAMRNSLYAYLLMGIFGYIAFPSFTPGNIIIGLDIRHGKHTIIMNTLIVIAYLGMALSLTTSFPLMIFPMRYSFFSLFRDNDYIDEQYKHMSLNFKLVFYMVTFGFDLAALLVSIYVTNLNTVFQIIGGTTSTILCYMIPGFLMISLYKKHNNTVSKEYYYGGYAMIVVSAITGILSTYVTFSSSNQPTD